MQSLLTSMQPGYGSAYQFPKKNFASIEVKFPLPDWYTFGVARAVRASPQVVAIRAHSARYEGRRVQNFASSRVLFPLPDGRGLG